MKGLLVIVSAPSGAGKTTVVRELVSRMCKYMPIQQVVTYTTRELKNGEKQGVDYHTISLTDFERKIKEGFFLEWSTAYDAYYGTPHSVLDDMARGITCILVIDRVGARQIKELVRDALTVWITVPSLEVLRERLERRGRDSQEQIKRRLFLAEIELDEEKRNPFYAYSIENSDKESTIIALENMIVKAMNKLI
jgi:guanylate kinase